MAKKKKKIKVKQVKGQLGKKKETAREKMIGQSIGYRYDVNLLPDYNKITPFYFFRFSYITKIYTTKTYNWSKYNSFVFDIVNRS